MFSWVTNHGRATRMLVAWVAVAVALTGAAASAAAQSAHGGNIELHASSNVTASSLGLPEFPHSRRYSEAHDDAGADVGFTFGDVHFQLLVSKYLTGATPEQVLDFYRRPLSRYGDVLECLGGQPVGPLTRTRGGLTCSIDEQRSGWHASFGETAHELRAGTRERFRIVSIETPRNDSTRFVLLFMDAPASEQADARR